MLKKLEFYMEYRKEALILAKAYQAEVMVKNQGQLLQARHSGNIGDFQAFIRGDRLDYESQEPGIQIVEILNQSVERVISRFLNKDYHKVDKIRNMLAGQWNVTLEKWSDAFEDQVFFNQTISPVEWACKNLAEISYSLAPVWGKINLRKENYAHALLQGYFNELLFNALKYRDHSQRTWLRIDFGEIEENAKQYLTIQLENDYIPEQMSQLGTGKGLDGIKNDLEMLNSPDNSRTLTIEKSEKTFKVTLYFIGDLFVPNPPLEIDTDKFFKKT
jgi:hypothetical protein